MTLDYYTFGLKQKGYNNVITGNGNDLAQQWKFGGKQYQEELGLNWYDITARNYDPALGRWMNLDPLAEGMRRHSPYNYAFDNPIYFIDPDGMEPTESTAGDGDGNVDSDSGGGSGVETGGGKGKGGSVMSKLFTGQEITQSDVDNSAFGSRNIQHSEYGTRDEGSGPKKVEEGESVFAKIGANFAKKDLSLDGSGDDNCCGGNPISGIGDSIASAFNSLFGVEPNPSDSSPSSGGGIYTEALRIFGMGGDSVAGSGIVKGTDRGSGSINFGGDGINPVNAAISKGLGAIVSFFSDNNVTSNTSNSSDSFEVVRHASRSNGSDHVLWVSGASTQRNASSDSTNFMNARRPKTSQGYSVDSVKTRKKQ